MFSGSGDILLVTAAGNLQAMDGRMWIIKDDDLRINVSQGTNVESSFATIQTQGDFWLFSLGLKGVTLDGEEIAGLVKPVNAQEYADIATIPLYNGMGASYVIDSDGRIVMRPNATEANDLFNGYNLYSIMAKEGVSLTELEQLKTAAVLPVCHIHAGHDMADPKRQYRCESRDHNRSSHLGHCKGHLWSDAKRYFPYYPSGAVPGCPGAFRPGADDQAEPGGKPGAGKSQGEK